jgi:hypothetical protein
MQGSRGRGNAEERAVVGRGVEGGEEWEEEEER